MGMGPDSLLSGAAAMDTGSRREAAAAAGVINGLGSIGPIVQEPIIGWLKTDYGPEAVLLFLVILIFAATVATGLFWYGSRRAGLRL
jgi:sugar phosphate permease